MALTVSVGDSINNLSDAFVLTVGMIISSADTINNLGDDLNKFGAWSISFGDKLSIKDKLFADFLQTLDLSDDLNAWSDALAKLNLGLYNISGGDSINNLGDALIQRLEHRVDFGDAIVGHADKLEIVKGILLDLSGGTLNNWLDSAVINGIENLSVSLGDTFSMSDTVAILLSVRSTTELKSSFVNYLRKYLNDPEVGN